LGKENIYPDGARFDAEGISMPFPQREVHLHGGGASVIDRGKLLAI
jgi:small-conductance mechanosensitive channel